MGRNWAGGEISDFRLLIAEDGNGMALPAKAKRCHFGPFDRLRAGLARCRQASAFQSGGGLGGTLIVGTAEESDQWNGSGGGDVRGECDSCGGKTRHKSFQVSVLWIAGNIFQKNAVCT